MSGKQSYSGEGAVTPDRYSDHFESDEEKKASKQKRALPPKKTSGHLDKSHGRRRRSDSLMGRVQGQGLRRGRGNSRKSSQASESIDMKQHDSFTTRVLSASRNRINELRNKVEELNIKIRELEQENKMFKTLQFRHEKAIRNIKDQESDLPLILDKHNNEIRSLKEQNRRLREKCEKSDRFLRDAEEELEKVKKKMKKFRELVEDKELLERDDLSRRIAKVELEMEEKEIKIKEFERHIEMLKKNHKHEIGIEIARQKDFKKQLEELKERNSQLEHQLKEKERALGYHHLHNLHKGKSPRSNSPDGNLARRMNRKAASMTELSLREKARSCSERQQADLHKQKELKESKEGKKFQKQKEAKGRNVSQMSPPEFSVNSTNGTLEGSGDGRDKEKQSAVMETTERAGKELDMKREQHEANKHLKDGLTEDRVTTGSLQEQEPKTRRDRLDSERSDTGERQETFLFETTEKRKGKMQEYKEKVESDLVLQAERRRKDDLLKRLRALDEANIMSPGTVAPTAPFKSHKDRSHGVDVFDELSFTTTTRSLHMFSQEGVNTAQAKMLGKDSGDYQPSIGPTRGHIHTPNSKPPIIFDDDKPFLKISSSSSSNTTTRQNEKKSNFLESLFGHQGHTPSANRVGAENDTFSTTKTLSMSKMDEENDPIFSTKPLFSNNQTRKTNSTFPWGENPSKTNMSISDSDKQSVILRGGPGSVGDLSQSQGKVQPQQRQQKSKFFSAKPSVTAIDNFDDEIEEVAL